MKILAYVPSTAIRLADPEKRDDRVTHVESVGGLVEAVRHGIWRATVVSLGADHVDPAVVTRVAGLRSAGVVIISSPLPTLEAALLAERIGAPAVLSEPFDLADLEALIHAETVSGSVVRLPEVLDSGPGIVGQSPAMAPVFDLIARVARSTSTVLITGESGTGKEVVARTLHEQSERRRAPFVAINCAAIPEHLLESELFGHEKGAFTGAIAARTGRFERANGGTLFLDEIGDMSLLLQAKVLRVLEERRVEPVGGEEEREVDVRLIAATNQHLGEAIQDGRFRQDLYYRLAVVEAVLPPLRDRAGDVRLLALHFAALFARQHGRPIEGIAEDALRELEDFAWPGNVRELRNVVDRAVLLARDGVILRGALRLGSSPPHTGARGDRVEEYGYPVATSLEDVEADHIARVLASVQGQVGRAAGILGVHRNTLSRKLGEYGIGTGKTSGAK